MTPSLNHYMERNARHLLSSRTNVYSKRNTADSISVTPILRTPNRWAALIYWYVKFSTPLLVRKYFLSSSQKKYQTVSINTFILEQRKLKRHVFATLLNFLHAEAFPDQIKQTYDGTISVQKDKASFTVPELPFNTYNQHHTFQQVFSAGTQGIHFTIHSRPYTPATTTVLFLFCYYKYLMTSLD